MLPISWPLVVVVLVVAIAIMGAILLSLTSSALRVEHVVRRLIVRLTRLGMRIRDFKDQRLGALTDFIPVNADGQTLLRGCLFGYALFLVSQDHLAPAFGWFMAGWVLDLTDGLTARRRGPSRIGKYLDPLVDIPSIIGFSWLLRDYFPHSSLPLTVAGLMSFRIGMFAIFHLAWSKRVGHGILPVTVGGQFKTLFVVLAYGLVLWQTEVRSVIAGAEICLGIAILLELGSLVDHSVLVRRWLRDTKQVVPMVRPTGTTPLDD